jgi:hypothetical protein
VQQVMHRASLPGRMVLPPMRYPGVGSLGASASTGSTVEQATAAALTTAAAVTPPPANVILIGAAAVLELLNKLGIGSGCGQPCIQATNIVNQAEPYLQQNILAYFAQPAPRTPASQAAALQQFDSIWQGVQASCTAIPGQPGQDCISDRQSGSCKWKQTTTSPLLAIPGEPQPGDCWNWFSGYRDPIANDTDVAAPITTSESTATSTSGTVGTTAGISNSTLFLFAGVGLLAFAVLGGDM